MCLCQSTDYMRYPVPSAHLGLHHCVACSKNVTEAECTDNGGILRLTCNACRAARNAAHAARRAEALAAAEAEAVDDAEEPVEGYAVADEGVEAVDAEDFFDNIYGDGNEFMNIDIPEEQTLNAAETDLLKTFRAELDKLHLASCSCCHEQS